MSQPTPSAPGPDASQAEIEADIAETRARLADSVDALADKVNVKARAQEKVDDVKSTAQAKVADARQHRQKPRRVYACACSMIAVFLRLR